MNFIIQTHAPYLYDWFVRPPMITNRYIHRHLKKQLQLEGRTVLDFGSGTGTLCSMFSPQQYFGIDSDHQRVEYAQKKHPEHSFHVLNDTKIPYADQSMDYIVIVAVLHHISNEDLHIYIEEFKRMLKPTGSMFIMEPCFSQNSPISNRFMRWADRGKYIRNELEYFALFKDKFECKVINRFKKCFLYNELFFTTHPKH
ncbi:class I SAM-dependent methyltransferase [Hazenella coriacea]|uniref:Methyltransferase family protein n=1 Tax=Hazenella coriacea TaxID=1179467 RepID=A0A4R3L7P7_9BACL|nr:class I SAM-dependent methyltransferase [Hazenella coriacea]TCS95803.1 methyltransferase family protein [Hazenella coriacea]